MCLSRLNTLSKTSGYAIKCVQKTDKPDEFKTFWPFFSLSGGGGRGDNPRTYNYTSRKEPQVKANVVYKLGRTYRVKHQREAHTDNTRCTYPALVHCYTSLKRAVFEHGTGNLARTYILVKYSGGQYTDGVSLTAKYVTPVAVLEGELLNKFMAHEHRMSFDETVASFLAAKYWLEG